MIAFDLICSNGHRFECWFRDSASFEDQKASGIINCPVCNDDQVEKVLSTFAIRKGGEKKKAEVDLYQTLRMVSEYVEKHFEDVGLDFTKEALKIHYGEVKKKNIKGMATPDQEKLLKEEGVQFFKIPIIKRLDN
ncbi:MAG: DUF1178 family protein [Desulfobacterales bacterium]|nr:DUF1178 family protein [Desulfobacterales bacterium]